MVLISFMLIAVIVLAANWWKKMELNALNELKNKGTINGIMA